MNKLVFVDTNVLIYLRDENALSKREACARWLGWLSAASAAYLNLQVLNEYAAVALRREPQRPLALLQNEIASFAAWGSRALERDDMEVAWTIRETFGFQWFDCLLLASASNDGCDVFLSEDMTDGARFGNLVIVNPFLHHPDDFLTSG